MTKPKAGQGADPGLRGILDGTEITTTYKIGYVLKVYREPSVPAPHPDVAREGDGDAGMPVKARAPAA